MDMASFVGRLTAEQTSDLFVVLVDAMSSDSIHDAVDRLSLHDMDTLLEAIEQRQERE